MSIEFETPAARIVKQFSEDGTEQFKIPANLPDITFLRALSVQGRLIFVQGSITSAVAGTIAEIIPVNGSTLFVYRVVISNTSGTLPIIEIQNDSNVRENIIVPANTINNSRFVDSLVGNSSKSFRVEKLTATGATQFASIFGWIENTSRIRDVTI